MSDQTKNEKPTSETYEERLARLDKKHNVKPMNLPKGVGPGDNPDAGPSGGERGKVRFSCAMPLTRSWQARCRIGGFRGGPRCGSAGSAGSCT